MARDRQASTIDRGARNVGVVQVGLDQDGVAQVRSDHRCSREVPLVTAETVEVRVVQGGPSECALRTPGCGQVGVGQVGVVEVHVADRSSAERDPAEVRRREVDPVSPCAGEVDPSKVPPREVHVLDISVRADEDGGDNGES